MSNPGVITLIESKIGFRKTFRVEDNLGEAIHIHYNDIRLDLTINELLDLADICEYTIYELVGVQNFNMDEFDSEFLVRYSEYLLDLIEVKYDIIPLDKLRYLTKNKIGIPITKTINLKNTKCMNAEYKPVVFNNTNIIVYGEENVVGNESGNLEVIRLCFKNEKLFVTKKPWIPFFFKWDKKRIKKVGYKIIKKLFRK